ncbi:MAG: hypothetical protein KAR45_16115 [Desulfobacteraceae bacterium]|nr:hypothetical protein [Desulfobacteraceae bacterium]
MKFNRQYIIFFIVFILLIISVIYRVNNPFIQEEVDTLTYTGKKQDVISLEHNRKEPGQMQSDTLVSKFLNRSKFSGEIIKDLFSLYHSSGDLKEKMDMEVPIGKITQEESILDKEFIDDPVLKISKDLLSYRFCGTYKSEGQRAVFLLRDKLVLVASAGDRIYGKYLIEEIQDNYIRIKALDLNETIHIDMREFNNE